jgi:acetylornithine deacetylase
MTYASDARYLQNIADTPTVLFGPGDIRNAHGPNEHVPISDLEKTVKTLSLAIMRYVNVHE